MASAVTPEGAGLLHSASACGAEVTIHVIHMNG